mmetsp:Transcript_18619/g.22749  ORF Transcript_18619/g.22749 Transcript_18619/m.22749 type:complete len:85 (+) Transcript_18619:339-593(+)
MGKTLIRMSITCKFRSNAVLLDKYDDHLINSLEMLQNSLDSTSIHLKKDRAYTAQKFRTKENAELFWHSWKRKHNKCFNCSDES